MSFTVLIYEMNEISLALLICRVICRALCFLLLNLVSPPLLDCFIICGISDKQYTLSTCQRWDLHRAGKRDVRGGLFT